MPPRKTANEFERDPAHLRPSMPATKLTRITTLGLWPTVIAAMIGTAAEPVFTPTDRQPTPAELATIPGVIPEKAEALRKDVQVPAEFDFTIFATPPAVNYPVFVAASPDGTLFVSSDGNGSLDRKPHRGRVLRVRDTDHDGQADEVRAFVPDVDSPRGLVWDHDRLYLLHPPDISVYIDKDGDGVADEERTLVKGVAFSFKDRPADHSSNGLELGVDGWLYAAIGDFGFMEATGADGRKLQLRGGGVLRVRPDGSGMELFAYGTRNILEVAMSPLLDGFARDNTNDGGGWDTRFHHFSGGITQHGYPKLFKNFTDEIIPPLADYGGGSGCGAAWIDEPGIPAKWNHAPFTADWGREWIYHHAVTPKGATFTATQEEFLHIPRATDLDIDGNGAIYASSWKGASFNWVGPDVGFLVRVTPKGYVPEPMPDFEKSSDKELASLLSSPSHRRRLAAQRALIRHDNGDGIRRNPALLLDVVADKNLTLPARVAAVFALTEALGAASADPLQRHLDDPTLQAWILRALADRKDLLAKVNTKSLVAAFRSSDPRVRKEAVIALARTENPDIAGSITAVIGDPDPIVSHTAVQAMIQLRAYEACLPIVDYGKTESPVRKAALRVLQSLPEPTVVGALIERLGAEKRSERRLGILTALCRLHFVEGPWKGDSWGTRPDTRGPFYQPAAWSETPKIAAALRAALEQASAEEAAHIGREMARHRIPVGDGLEKLIARASQDPSLLPALAAQLAQAESIPGSAVLLLAEFATSKGAIDADRAQAVIALAKSDSPNAWHAVFTAHPKVQSTQTENNLAERERRAVIEAPNIEKAHAVFEEEAARLSGETSLIAEGFLLRLAGRKIGSPEVRNSAAKALDAGWKEPKRRVQILRAAAEVRDASRAVQFIAALDDPDPEVAKAARETTRRLRLDSEKVRADATLPKISEIPLPQILETLATSKGDILRGEQLFTQLSCVSCHTVKAGDPLKGPFLGTIANTYRRRELAEAILLPNKTIAQGFATHHFELKDGTEIDGFVVQEAADVVTVRNVSAQDLKIPVNQIAKRERQERSIMPEGLVAGLSLADLASLLDYLESLAPKAAAPKP